MKSENMRTIMRLTAGVFLCLLWSACTPGTELPPAASPTSQPEQTSTIAPTSTFTLTPTSEPTSTSTPVPTNTATATPLPLENQIAFFSDRGGENAIYRMNADGSDLTNLVVVNSGDREETISWSPDGDWIAYDSAVNGSYEIFVIDVYGNAPTQMTTAAGNTRYPAWSPDGKWIAYAVGNTVHLLEVATMESEQIAEVSPAQATVLQLAWSPDSQYLTYLGVAQLHDWEIFSFNLSLNSGGEPFIDHPGANDGFLTWSPIGDLVAFCAATSGSRAGFELYVAEVNTISNLSPITSHKSIDLIQSAWSPDGNWLAYSVLVEGTRKWDIFRIDPSGQNQIRLTEHIDDGSGYYAGNRHPVWSPDGTMILFESTRDGNSEIFVMNADGTGQSNLTNHPGFDWKPQWQPGK